MNKPFKSPITRNFKSLVKDITQDKSIVLFCGAGINCCNNIKLSWPDLIETPFRLALNHIAREEEYTGEWVDLLHSSFKRVENEGELTTNILRLRNFAISEFPYEIRSAILKSIHLKEYIPLLQDYIYSQCSKDVIRRSFFRYYKKKNKNEMDHLEVGYEYPSEYEEKIPTLHTLYILAKFILLYDRLEAIVTYNYDNFLTEAIKLLAQYPEEFFYKPEYDKLKRKGIVSEGQGKSILKIRVLDISGKTYDDTITKDDIVIFHVHGFIPPKDGPVKCDSSSVILSQDEYCDTVTDIQTWQNAVQIHYLCHCTCLFVGSSMSDLTVKRMIDFAKDNGNEENIYYLNLWPRIKSRDNERNDEEYLEKYRLETGKSLLSRLKTFYISDLGIKCISYKGEYHQLYEELGKVLYLKAANRLKGQ